MNNKIIGVIASSGGSIIFELLPFLKKNKIDLMVVTDRPCAIESKCVEEKINFIRIVHKDREVFSSAARSFFKENNVIDLVLLFFTRLIGKEIYNNFLTFNIHPSFLPLFPGLGPIKKCLNSGVKLLGASVHRVNESLDGGPILAQIVNSFTLEKIDFISFMQKVYLTLAVIDAYIFHPDKLVNEVVMTTHYMNASFKLSHAAELFFKDIELKYATKILGIN